jgi:hypothetical protein
LRLSITRRQALLGLGAAALLGRPAGAQYQPQGRDLVARLMGLQAEDGALVLPGMGPDRTCDPLVANQAVTGLLLGAPPRSRTDAATVARAWMRWYTANLNADGTIDVHRGVAGSLKPSGDPEGQDARAGSFLTVAGAYLDVTGDSATLLAFYPKLLRVAQAAVHTLQRSGLAAPRPGAKTLYLTNNVEVWRGFDAFSRLSVLLRKRDEEREYRAQADALLTAIDRWFWVQSQGQYAWAFHVEGGQDAGLARWSPNWTANLAAVAELPEDERRTDLYGRLFRQFPTQFPQKKGTEGTFLSRLLGKAAVAPGTIEDAGDLQMLVAWGLAALSRHDEALLERYQVKLAQAPWDRLKELDPALVGGALRLGGGKTKPVPAPEEAP